MRFVYGLALASLLFTSFGCATLFSGSTDMVTFTSDPAGAEVLIGGLSRGTTPVTIPVKRAGFGSRNVTMRMEGMNPVTFEMSSSFNTVSLLNILVPVGFIVDAATGSITKYSQQNYNVNMRTGSVAYDMKDLEVNVAGAIVVPETGGDVVVIDQEAGVQFVFNQ